MFFIFVSNNKSFTWLIIFGEKFKTGLDFVPFLSPDFWLICIELGPGLHWHCLAVLSSCNIGESFQTESYTLEIRLFHFLTLLHLQIMLKYKVFSHFPEIVYSDLYKVVFIHFEIRLIKCFTDDLTSTFIQD